MREFIQKLAEKYNFNADNEWRIYEQTRPKLSKEDHYQYLLNEVSIATGVSKNSLLARSRKREVMYVRHMLVYLLYTRNVASLKEIGRMVGGRHHSTVINSRDLVKDLISVKDGLMYPIYEQVKYLLDEVNLSSSTEQLPS